MMCLALSKLPSFSFAYHMMIQIYFLNQSYFLLHQLFWVPPHKERRSNRPSKKQKSANDENANTCFDLRVRSPFCPWLVLPLLSYCSRSSKGNSIPVCRSWAHTKVPPSPSWNEEILIPQPWGSWGTVNQSIPMIHKIVKLLHEQGQSEVKQDVIK